MPGNKRYQNEDYKTAEYISPLLMKDGNQAQQDLLNTWDKGWGITLGEANLNVKCKKHRVLGAHEHARVYLKKTTNPLSSD